MSEEEFVDRRGLDAAVIALIKQLHEQFVDAHAHVHDTFVDSHEREHALRTEAIQQALELAADKHIIDMKAVYHFYDTILQERDTRYEERFQASQTAITAAFDAREKALVEAFDAREKAIAAALEAKDRAVAFAFESSEKAITKAEASIIKQSDATYVTLNELSKSMSAIMPRTEAEQRFLTLNTIMDDLRDRLKGLESLKQGSKDAFSNIQMFLGIVLVLITLGGILIGTR